MDIVRAHVVLPIRLAEQIDKIAGPRGRSAFLVESAEREIRRFKLQAFLDDSDPAWKPELRAESDTDTVAAWDRQQRQKKSIRQLRIEAWAEERNS